MRSWPFGAVRMTERFLAQETVKPKHVKALREHVGAALDEVPWLGKGGDLAGIGGTVRNLGDRGDAAARSCPRSASRGSRCAGRCSTSWSTSSPTCTPAERGKVPGIKPERGDLILAGALVVQSVMEAGGFDCMEVTEAGLREGVFLGRLLEAPRPAAVQQRAARVGPQPRRRVPPGLRPHQPRRRPGAGDVGRARERRPGRARAAVGRRDAARHRHDDRLRRPPQALALPDPQRRPAGLLPARDRADRPDGPLSPQGQPDARAVLGARRATATRRC